MRRRVPSPIHFPEWDLPDEWKDYGEKNADWFKEAG